MHAFTTYPVSQNRFAASCRELQAGSLCSPEREPDFARDDDVLHRELISRGESSSISRVLKFLGKYREAGLLLLRASVGLIFILICAPVLLSGEHRWWQFGSAMRVFNFHSHLDWWGFLGALAGCIGGIFMMLGFAFRIGILLAFLVALVTPLLSRTMSTVFIR